MEKKRNTNSCPIEACEKVYKAVTISPAFLAIRRIPYRLKSRSASPASVKTSDIQSKTKYSKQNTYKNKEEAEAVAIAINFDYSSLPPPNEKPNSDTPPKLIQKNTHVLKAASRIKAEATSGNNIAGKGIKTNPEVVKSGHVKLEEGEKSGVHIEDRVTDYIKRAKVKNGTISHPGEEINASGKDKLSDNVSGKDKFSDYIDRTKHKLRTTLSFGAGKSNSFNFK